MMPQVLGSFLDGFWCHLPAIGRSRLSRADCHSRLSRADCCSRLWRADCRSRLWRADCRLRLWRADCRSRLSRADCRSRLSRADCRSRLSRADCRSRLSRADCRSRLSVFSSKFGADQREARRARKLAALVFLLRKVLGLFWGLPARFGHTPDYRPTGGAGASGSCGAPLDTRKELAFGALHRQSCLGIGLALGEAIQIRQHDVGPQVTLATREFAKHLEGCGPPQVDTAALAVGCCEDLGYGGRTMEVHVRVQVLAVESVDSLGMFRIDVPESDVLANYRAVLGLHETGVAAVIRSRFGLFDEQLFQYPGHSVIDELAAVVGVESADHEGELLQDRFERRDQPQLRDLRGRGYNLPLRHFVDGIDVI